MKNPELNNQGLDTNAGGDNLEKSESSLPNKAAGTTEAKDRLSLEQRFNQLVGAARTDSFKDGTLKFDEEEYAEQLSIEDCMIVFQYLLQHDPQLRFLSPRSW